MELVYIGKTKDVYDLGNGDVLFRFKDDATVNEDGKIDPGGNLVGLSIDGLGIASLRMSKYFFEKLGEAGYFTHYVGCDLAAGEMTVRHAKFFGNGVEIICRLKAVGSFRRRYGDYCAEGQALDYLVEASLKDDERGDPFIAQDTLAELGIMRAEEYEAIKSLTKNITTVINDDLADKGLALYDLKYEFGLVDGKVALIDEISAGNMRVYKGDSPLPPMELGAYFP